MAAVVPIAYAVAGITAGLGLAYLSGNPWWKSRPSGREY